MRQPHLRRVHPDVWAGVAMLVLSTVALYEVTRIFVPAGLNDHLGPRAFPAAASVFLLVTALVMIVRSARRSPDVAGDHGSVHNLLVVVAASAVFVGLLATVGFLTASIALLTAMFVRLGERRWWLALLVAAGVSLSLDAAFALGLGVVLPGSLFGI